MFKRDNEIILPPLDLDVAPYLPSGFCMTKDYGTVCLYVGRIAVAYGHRQETTWSCDIDKKYKSKITSAYEEAEQKMSEYRQADRDAEKVKVQSVLDKYL